MLCVTAVQGPFTLTRSVGLPKLGRVLSAIGAVVARFVHTEEVTGSNPVSRTENAGDSSHEAPAGSIRAGAFRVTWGGSSAVNAGSLPPMAADWQGATHQNVSEKDG